VATRQVVNVTSGRVRDEVSGLLLGRWPEAPDGTWVWEVRDSGASKLISVAIAVPGIRVLDITQEGFL
jgi:hypothetical protein